MKKPKQTQLNPNWSQLQQKLNNSKASRSFKSSDEDTRESLLGKKNDFCFWGCIDWSGGYNP
ncbi:unnamed protein product [Sphenostylis stenocarpa]|uniref:Uncharacterized protein n=1 Tax=Sphenostylis stenocarpa TaxID=92480 RepID=A0AA86VII1_9FABA|nr:unnamed protein product [Sphenostylis stenocarpa]